MSAREPLSAEERELQRRLQDWTVSGPPDALDARILAQARTAAAANAPGAAGGVRRPRQHRPLMVGLASAAALVLTVGLVWRVAEQPASMERPPATTPPQMRASEPATPRLESASDQPMAADEQRAQRDRGVAAEAARSVAPPAAGSGRDQAGESAVRAEPPPPGEPAATADPRTIPLRSPPVTRSSADAVEAAAASEDPGRDPVEAFAAPPPPPAPPAPAPAPHGFEPELAKVRELIARGEQAAARSALLELRRRHPERALPDDLQVWLDRPPTP